LAFIAKEDWQFLHILLKNMPDINHIQQALFQQIKEKMPPHLSFSDEVGSALGLSSDSVYRRIRGEKELSYSELQKLVTYFQLPPQRVLSGMDSGEVVFRHRAINHDTFTLLDYFRSTLEIMNMLRTQQDADLIYTAKDIPVFHNFLFDEMAWFKMFVWQKTILAFPEFENQKFSLGKPDKEILETGRKLLEGYNRIPSTELWNEATITSMLRQVEFYVESDFFEDVEEAFVILDKVSLYLDHVKRQADTGKKFLYGQEPDNRSGEFKLYNNEVVRTDNTILARVGEKTTTFLTHCTMNFMSTANEQFSNTTREWMLNLIRRSDLISTVSEKHRNQFFSAQQAQVKKTRERLKFLVGREA
jgi:hypothetical protein